MARGVFVVCVGVWVGEWWGEVRKRKMTLLSMPVGGQAMGAKTDEEGPLSGDQEYAPEGGGTETSHVGMTVQASVSPGGWKLSSPRDVQESWWKRCSTQERGLDQYTGQSGPLTAWLPGTVSGYRR
jgi:hypothetical protein